MKQRRGSQRHWWVRAIAALLVLSIAGCGGSAGADVYETISPGVLEAGQRIPVPKTAALEIDGKVVATNDRGRLLLDVRTLEKLGLVRYSVDDPWLKRRISYTGVLLSDLVRLVRPARSATTIHLVALDDYEVDIAVTDAERWPVMLATRLDGEHMEIANGGPARIVFPYGLVDGIDELQYKDLWIWNVKSITFR